MRKLFYLLLILLAWLGLTGQSPLEGMDPVIFGVVVGAAVAFVMLVALLLIRRARKAKEAKEAEEAQEEAQEAQEAQEAPRPLEEGVAEVVPERLEAAPEAEPVKAEPVRPKAEPVVPEAEPVRPKVEPVRPKVEPVKPKVEPVKPIRPKVAPIKAPEVLVEPVPKPVMAPKKAKVAGKTLKEGLAKTQEGFIAKLSKLFRGRTKVDTDLMDELEQVLFTADIGVKASQSLFTILEDQLNSKEMKDPERVWGFMKERVGSILTVDAPPFDIARTKPFVVMVIGVNGVGKTTTIGKLASLFKQQGKDVLLAAGDTFRAAAVEQLEIWANRADCRIVKGKEKQDPASVMFDALSSAKAKDVDVVLADTAGRLHTKVNLVEELKKVKRVMEKVVPGAPHEVILVLDATTGQNALVQARMFNDAVGVTGIVITKLDGTAKGGIIIGICEEFKLPVRYIGIGEKVEDLREFDPTEFTEALFDVNH